jgi:hypothetical protein
MIMGGKVTLDHRDQVTISHLNGDEPEPVVKARTARTEDVPRDSREIP